MDKQTEVLIEQAVEVRKQRLQDYKVKLVARLLAKKARLTKEHEDALAVIDTEIGTVKNATFVPKQ